MQDEGGPFAGPFPLKRTDKQMRSCDARASEFVD